MKRSTPLLSVRPTLPTLLLALCVLFLTACDGRVMAVGHILSLVLTCGMVWATINMDKVR